MRAVRACSNPARPRYIVTAVTMPHAWTTQSAILEWIARIDDHLSKPRLSQTPPLTAALLVAAHVVEAQGIADAVGRHPPIGTGVVGVAGSVCCKRTSNTWGRR